MSDPFQFVERITVRRVGTSWLGEARTHAHFAVGEVLSSPAAALESAAKAMDAEMRPKWEAWQARHAATDDFEDLL